MNLDKAKQAIISGDFQGIQDIVREMISAGAAPQTLLDQALIPGLEEVGKRFSRGEIFIPEMMVSAKVMHLALDVLKPLLGTKGQATVGRFAIGTVKDDLHDIGKNIVATMMEGAGFEVTDLGVDCPVDRFVKAIEDGAQIIGISAILTTVLPNIGRTIRAIEERGLRGRAKILVGGAAVTEEVVRDMGADAYCSDAGVGIEKAKALLGN